MNALVSKLKEVLFSVLPVTVLVTLLYATGIARFDGGILLRFYFGAAAIVVGLALFLWGVEIGVLPLSGHIGTALTKSNKVWIVVAGGLLIGFIITFAEPDLQVLAKQIEFVTSGAFSSLSILAVVSAGIGVMLALGLLRIVFNVPLYQVLTLAYLVVLALSFFSSGEFLAIAFDASGSTTGSLTVPFTLAMAVSISSMKRDAKAGEKDSFGLVGFASVGAIISVLAMSLFVKKQPLSATIEASATGSLSLRDAFFSLIPPTIFEVLLALSPILVIFIVLQFVSLRLDRRAFVRILIGLGYSFLGLVIFLVGVNAGFLEVGRLIGNALAGLNLPAVLVAAGFVIGLVTILAEPAVYVLTSQIEEVTSGYVRKKAVLFSLCLGVGAAVALSMVRILVPGLQLWHILLPGYILCTALPYIVPKIFVGIAFDAGGVASGPMAATFLLSFAQGAAHNIASADILLDGFGIIAIISMMPILALLILGLLYKAKSRKKESASDV